jgi:hypothetical protein
MLVMGLLPHRDNQARNCESGLVPARHGMPVTCSCPSCHRPRIQLLPRPATGRSFYTHQRLGASEYVPHLSACGLVPINSSIDRRRSPVPLLIDTECRAGLRGPCCYRGIMLLSSEFPHLIAFLPPTQLPPWSFQPVRRPSVAGTWVGLRLPLRGALRLR